MKYTNNEIYWKHIKQVKKMLNYVLFIHQNVVVHMLGKY